LNRDKDPAFQNVAF